MKVPFWEGLVPKVLAESARKLLLRHGRKRNVRCFTMVLPYLGRAGDWSGPAMQSPRLLMLGSLGSILTNFPTGRDDSRLRSAS